MTQGAVKDAEYSYPEGTLIDVKLTVRLPVAATEEQVSQWLHHNIAQQGGMAVDSPLYSHTPEAWGTYGMDWADTGDTGREERFDHEITGQNSSRYKVRYLRERREA